MRPPDAFTPPPLVLMDEPTPCPTCRAEVKAWLRTHYSGPVEPVIALSRVHPNDTKGAPE